MSKWKLGGYICAAVGFVVGLVADALSEKEQKEYIDQAVLDREADMVAYAVDNYVGDAIDTAVAKRFIAAGEADPEKES